MTVKLLVDWKDPSTGRQYRIGNLLDTDDYTEAGLIASKQAQADLTGGTAQTDPVVNHGDGQVVRANPAGTALVVDGTTILNLELDLMRNNTARNGLTLYGPEIGYSAPATSNGAGVTINSTGPVTVSGETWFEVSATATSGTNNWFEIQLNSIPAFVSDTLTAEFQTDNPGGTASIVAYMGTASYAAFANATKNIGTDGDGSNPFHHKGHLGITWVTADWTKNGYSSATNVQVWTNCKLRVTVSNGQTVVFRLRSIQAGASRGPGRLAIVADDGYRSWIRLGLPILESYGYESTMSIITSEVGNTAGGYVSMDDLLTYVSRGNECIAHGPLSNGTNLFAAPYTTTEQRVADMVSSRDYLLANGLTGREGATCYVWPQGLYASGNGEADLLDAMQVAGFRRARVAVTGTGTPSTRSQHIRALSPLCHQRLTLPILGHTYQGVAATADDATETSNINAIITSIQALATNGSDGVLMLHKVVARGGATGGAGTIEIETDRLIAVCDAIKTLVSARTLDVVLFSDL